MFYFSLGNFDVIVRLRVDIIFLLVIVYYEDICEYGIDRLLILLFDELVQLVQLGGFIFNLDGFYFLLRGVVIVVVVDIFVSYYIVGYKEGVGGVLRKCWYCNVDYDRM